MKDVQIDDNSEMRCWNCGGKGFTEKRTARSKAAVGVGVLATKKSSNTRPAGSTTTLTRLSPSQGRRVGSTGSRGRNDRELADRRSARDKSRTIAATASRYRSFAQKVFMRSGA